MHRVGFVDFFTDVKRSASRFGIRISHIIGRRLLGGHLKIRAY